MGPARAFAFAVAGTLLATAANARADGTYSLTTTAPACAAGADCVATVRIEALGDYHVNDSYPYRMTAVASRDGVTFHGKTDANVFSKRDGDFAKQGDKVGVLTVRFKAGAKGPLRITGELRMSVCSDGNCVIDRPSVSIDVTVN